MQVVIIAVSLLSALGQAETDSPMPRRVVWVAVDSLRADHLHSTGYDRQTSPWIDKMVPSSAVFESAYSPSNSTAFSVAATMAGRHYSLMDHDSHPPHIPADVVTLPSIFQNGGFRTFGWIANPVLIANGNAGFARGFDEWHKIIPKSAPKPTIDEVAEYVKRNYEQTEGTEFHYVHTMDVHEPYVPPMPFDRLWPEHANTGAVNYGTMRQVDGRYVVSNLPYHSEGHGVRDTDIAFLTTQYDGAIRYTDTQLPALLNAIGYDPKTDLLILSADHGEQLFEHDFWGHGKSLYPGEINVPLLIRGPGITPGRYAQPVSLIDLFPTLCALFRLEPPDGIPGVSLLPTLTEGSPVPLHAVYSEMPYWTGGVFAPEAAVVYGTDFYKLAADVHWRRPWQVWPVAEELYDLNDDPRCFTNLTTSMRERADQLNGLLREINPRFAPYTSEAIQEKDVNALLGSELMPSLTAEDGGRVRVRTTSTRASGNGGLSLVAPQSDLEMHVSTTPGISYLLEIHYTLESGEFHLSMLDEGSGEPFWGYTLRKAGRERKTLRAMVKPFGRLSELEVKALTPGKAQFHQISLRAAAVPSFEVVQWRRAESNEDSTQPMQDEVRSAIEALGYVD